MPTRKCATCRGGNRRGQARAWPQLEIELQTLLLPKDPNDERNIFLEIRAGTGGDEAAMFAGDLFRMYSRYAERQRWQVEIMSASAVGARRLQGNHLRASSGTAPTRG